MTARRATWQRTPHDEWLCVELALLAVQRETGWYLYPFASTAPVRGPFETLAAACEAAETADGVRADGAEARHARVAGG